MSGQVLTAAGAGVLSALMTPMFVGALSQLGRAPEDRKRYEPYWASREAGIAVLSCAVGGGISLAIGLALWRRGTRQSRARARTAALAPERHRSPAMRSAGIAMTATGLGLAGLAILMAYVPGECLDTDPPECSYPQRPAGIAAGVAGLAAVAAGIPLWIVGSEPAAPASRPTASLTMMPAGAALGGTF